LHVERRFDWEVNPHFISRVKAAGTNHATRPIVLICRSGNRSLEAGKPRRAGFAGCITSCGFEGEPEASSWNDDRLALGLPGNAEAIARSLLDMQPRFQCRCWRPASQGQWGDSERESSSVHVFSLV
jgi:hypothetical protein